MVDVNKLGMLLVKHNDSIVELKLDVFEFQQTIEILKQNKEKFEKEIIQYNDVIVELKLEIFEHQRAITELKRLLEEAANA